MLYFLLFVVAEPVFVPVELLAEALEFVVFAAPEVVGFVAPEEEDVAPEFVEFVDPEEADDVPEVWDLVDRYDLFFPEDDSVDFFGSAVDLFVAEFVDDCFEFVAFLASAELCELF